MTEGVVWRCASDMRHATFTFLAILRGGLLGALLASPSGCSGDATAGPCDPAVSPEPARVAELCPAVGVCALSPAAVSLRCTPEGLLCDFSQVPGFEEIDLTCDGRDADCDGAVDEDAPDCGPRSASDAARIQPGVSRMTFQGASSRVVLDVGSPFVGAQGADGTTRITIGLPPSAAEAHDAP